MSIRTVILALAKLKEASAKSIIRTQLGHKNVLISSAVADYLIAIEDVSSVKEFAHRLKTNYYGENVFAIVDSLEIIENIDPDLIGQLLPELFSSNHWSSRYAATKFVGERKLREYRDKVAKMLDDHEPLVRAEAVNAIEYLELKEQYSSLSKMLAAPSEDDIVKIHLVSAVKKLGGKQGLDLLANVAESNDGVLGGASLRQLLMAGDPRGRLIARRLLRSKVEITQLDALDAVRDYMDKAAINDVSKLAHSKNEMVRKEAKKVLKILKRAK